MNKDNWEDFAGSENLSDGAGPSNQPTDKPADLIWPTLISQRWASDPRPTLPPLSSLWLNNPDTGNEFPPPAATTQLVVGHTATALGWSRSFPSGEPELAGGNLLAGPPFDGRSSSGPTRFYDHNPTARPRSLPPMESPGWLSVQSSSFGSGSAESGATPLELRHASLGSHHQMPATYSYTFADPRMAQGGYTNRRDMSDGHGSPRGHFAEPLPYFGGQSVPGSSYYPGPDRGGGYHHHPGPPPNPYAYGHGHQPYAGNYQVPQGYQQQHPAPAAGSPWPQHGQPSQPQQSAPPSPVFPEIKKQDEHRDRIE